MLIRIAFQYIHIETNEGYLPDFCQSRCQLRYSSMSNVSLAKMLNKYKGCSNMNASSFITFGTYMLWQNGIRFYKTLYPGIQFRLPCTPGQFFMGVKLFIGTPRMRNKVVLKNGYGLFENAWCLWQPIANLSMGVCQQNYSHLSCYFS